VSGLGTGRITVQFNLNRNIDAAAQDIQAAIANASRKLPAEMTTLRQPLGIVVVSGLLTSQLLTLFITPVIYLSLEDARRGVLSAFGRFRSVPPVSGQPAE
jgi:multidrug efflux pump subunit AcrB